MTQQDKNGSRAHLFNEFKTNDRVHSAGRIVCVSFNDIPRIEWPNEAFHEP